MTALRLHAAVAQLKLTVPFRISGYLFKEQAAVRVTLDDGTHRGRGEASGIFYLGDTAASMMATLEQVRRTVEGGIDRAELQELLPAGGPRNALDCALWELEAQRTGTPVWRLAGLEAPRALVTTFTIGADDPEVMAAGARQFGQARALKLKLTGDLGLDLERVRAVRGARPEVWMSVDANQGYSIERLDALIQGLVAEHVSLLEQPLKRGQESDLDGVRSPIPIAADESALTLQDVAGLTGRFQVVTIKLDKCGGLTEGLAMAREARRLGLRVMVGNMMGSSLAMAPAFLVGQLCDVVDLDGPALITNDCEPAVTYRRGEIFCDDRVWGATAQPERAVS